ncbi:hypothetical protein ACKGJY_05910 [Hyunsoonleella sp. 2307UL5-6]|uniref:hypothetical protein n=1 Tax=Hyunsoonleella sp. 2307UL5-6 TaxID=3384768 RepID=UPI0039BD7F04
MRAICKLILVTCLFCSNSCKEKIKDSKEVSQKETINHNDSILKLETNYVNMYINTFMAVPCEEFGESFFKVKKEKLLKVNSSDHAKDFIMFLKEGLLAEEIEQEIDTRVKVKMFYTDNRLEEVCLGLHRFEFNGKVYFIEDDFKKFLVNLTDSSL